MMDTKTCRICRSVNHVDVHHINMDQSDNRSANLIPLCRSCHRYVHGWSHIPYSALRVKTRLSRHKVRRLKGGRDIMTTLEGKKLLTPREVGKILGVTPRTIVRWINEGRLPGVKMGRVWRVRQTDVRRAMIDGLESK